MTKPDTLQRRGLMFVLSSPSGAGKTTISRKLLEHDVDVLLVRLVVLSERKLGHLSRDFTELIANLAEQGEIDFVA